MKTEQKIANIKQKLFISIYTFKGEKIIKYKKIYFVLVKYIY